MEERRTEADERTGASECECQMRTSGSCRFTSTDEFLCVVSLMLRAYV